MPEICILSGKYAKSATKVSSLRPCEVDDDEVFFPFTLGSGELNECSSGQVNLTEKELIEALEMLRAKREQRNKQ